MKLLFVLLFLSAVSILADPSITLDPSITPDRHQVQGTGPIEIDGLVYSQTYDYGLIEGAQDIEERLGRRLCDDFTLDDDYTLKEVYIWMIWTGEQGSMMNFVISEDDALDSDPNTNIDVWAESIPCNNTFTGDSRWGYDIYETHCVINADVCPELDSGKHYYFEVQAAVIDCSYILFSGNYVGDYCWYDGGSGVWERSDFWAGMDTDLFFDFLGEPVLALESETWGSIKTLF